MATNDLITELGKEGVKLDDVMEKRISAAILKQLGEVNYTDLSDYNFIFRKYA